MSTGKTIVPGKAVEVKVGCGVDVSGTGEKVNVLVGNKGVEVEVAGIEVVVTVGGSGEVA